MEIDKLFWKNNQNDQIERTQLYPVLKQKKYFFCTHLLFNPFNILHLLTLRTTNGEMLLNFNCKQNQVQLNIPKIR